MSTAPRRSVTAMAVAREAFAIVRRRWRTLGAVALVVTIVSYGLWIAVATTFGSASAQPEPPAWVVAGIAVNGLTYLVVVASAVTVALRAPEDDDEIDWAAALRSALTRLPALAVLVAAVGAAMGVAVYAGSLLGGNEGFGGSVTLLAGLTVVTLWCLAVPALLDPATPGGFDAPLRALTKSMRLVRANLGPIAGVVGIAILQSILVSFVLLVAAVPLASRSGGGLITATLVIEVLWGVTTWPVHGALVARAYVAADAAAGQETVAPQT